MIALDRGHLNKHNADPQSLAGVIAFSGMYDLSPRSGIFEQQRVAAKDFRHRSGGAQTSVAGELDTRRCSAVSDSHRGERFPRIYDRCKSFFDALERAGNSRVERWIVPERGHFTILRLEERDNEARLLLLEFLKAEPLPAEFEILVRAKRRWRDPPFNTMPFWRYEKLLRLSGGSPLRHPAGFGVQQRPLRASGVAAGNLYAMDLFAFVDSLPAEKVGRGDYLITTSIRNEEQFWKRQQVEPYQPVIVVALDSEKNLFRLGVFYRAHREYSWKSSAQPPMMARPLGAFIHFLKEPPPELAVQEPHFGLTEESFRLVGADPLAGLQKLPQDIQAALTFRNGCVYCHSIGAVGSRSYHVDASTGRPHGGVALTLENYPAEVWKAFIFDQTAVAKKIGASPNPVATQTRQALYELVNRLRQQRGGKK